MVYDDEKICERILKLMHRENLSQLDFSSKIKRSQSNVSEILRGKRQITRSFLADIENAFPKLIIDWIIYGEGKMYADDPEPEQKQISDTRPRLPKTFAEGNIEAFLTSERAKECQQKNIVKQFPNYEFTLILKNDRMSPKYQRGDELAFRKTSIIEWGNDYLIDTTEGPKFKKILNNGESVKCESYNKKSYPTFDIPKDKIYGYYKCVGVIRVL